MAKQKFKQPQQSEPTDNADAILKRVTRDSEAVGQSSIARTANQARDHLMGKDADGEDPIEVWGKRIGRFLSVVAVVALLIWLFNYLGRP